MKELFEVHLAAPRLDEAYVSAIRSGLKNMGAFKTKYFQGVYDITPITPGCMNGHDIKNPGTMSTVKVSSLEEAIHSAKLAMKLLDELSIEGGNFEIEAVLSDSIENLRSKVEQSLREFSLVPNSPQFENHLIFKEVERELPSIQQLIDFFGPQDLTLNQVVDFTHSQKVDASTVISRVATFYQPDKVQAKTAEVKLVDLLASLGKPRLITEEVLFVGELKI